MQVPALNTPSGISLLPVAIEHAAALASLVQQNVEHLQAYLPAVAGLVSVESADAHLRFAVERSSKAEVLEWHLFTSNILCGSVRVKDIDHIDRKAKIGYFVGQQFTGRGIASASVFAVMEFCFASLRLNRLELRCASGNAPSKRVAERLGFVHEGTLRQEEFLNGHFVDHHVYGLLAEDFGARPCLPTSDGIASIAGIVR